MLSNDHLNHTKHIHCSVLLQSDTRFALSLESAIESYHVENRRGDIHVAERMRSTYHVGGMLWGWRPHDLKGE